MVLSRGHAVRAKYSWPARSNPVKVGSGIAMSELKLDLNDMCYLIDLLSSLGVQSGLSNGMQKLMPIRGI